MTLTGTFTALREVTSEVDRVMDAAFAGFIERTLMAELTERAIAPLFNTGKEYVIRFGKTETAIRNAQDAFPVRTLTMSVAVRLALAAEAEIGDEIDRNGVPLEAANWYLTYFWPKARRAWRQRGVSVQVGHLTLTVEAFDTVWMASYGRGYAPLVNEDCSELLAWRRVV